MDPPIDDERLDQVRTLLESQMGYRELVFDQAQLPTEFHCVADLARQFGIGDDGTRPRAMALMPIEFVRESADRVAAIEPALCVWLVRLALNPRARHKAKHPALRKREGRVFAAARQLSCR